MDSQQQPLLSSQIARETLLIVEDNRMIRQVYQNYLRNCDYDIIYATTALEALQYKHKNFHCILLDIGLPDKPGFEVAREFRHCAIHKTTPIIAITAHGDTIKDECFDAGINQVIIKPIFQKELLGLLEQCHACF